MKKGAIFYVTLIEMPMFSNYTKKFKFSIFEAKFEGFKKSWDLYKFSIIRRINFNKGVKFQLIGGRGFISNIIYTGSTIFEVENHGEVSFIHHTSSEAQRNMISLIFTGSIESSLSDGREQIYFKRPVGL